VVFYLFTQVAIGQRTVAIDGKAPVSPLNNVDHGQSPNPTQGVSALHSRKIEKARNVT